MQFWLSINKWSYENNKKEDTHLIDLGDIRAKIKLKQLYSTVSMFLFTVAVNLNTRSTNMGFFIRKLSGEFKYGLNFCLKWLRHELLAKK